MIKLKDILLEQSNESYKFGFLGIELKEFDERTSIIDSIDKDDIHDKGIEDEPHITVVYGFDEKVNMSDILEYLEELDSFEITCDKIDLFENEEYDVLKYNCVVPEHIVELRDKLIEDFNIDNKFPEYKPHITIGYLKKGAGKKYTKKLKENLIISCDTIRYSDPDKVSSYIYYR